jgi:hypothetical protein
MAIGVEKKVKKIHGMRKNSIVFWAYALLWGGVMMSVKDFVTSRFALESSVFQHPCKSAKWNNLFYFFWHHYTKQYYLSIRSTTCSAIARELVSPGDSIPIRLKKLLNPASDSSLIIKS